MIYGSEAVLYCPELAVIGNIVFISEPFNAFGVIIDQVAWSELAGREFDKEVLDRVHIGKDVIPLRILGERIANANIGIQETLIVADEPCAKVFRHYAFVNHASPHYRIFNPTDDLVEVISVFRHFVTGDKYFNDVMQEIQLLIDYQAGKIFSREELSCYQYKLLQIFKKSIPVET